MELSQINDKTVAISTGMAIIWIATGLSRAPILQPSWSQISQYSALFEPKLHTRSASSLLPTHCRMTTSDAAKKEKKRYATKSHSTSTWLSDLNRITYVLLWL